MNFDYPDKAKLYHLYCLESLDQDFYSRWEIQKIYSDWEKEKAFEKLPFYPVKQKFTIKKEIVVLINELFQEQADYYLRDVMDDRIPITNNLNG